MADQMEQLNQLVAKYFSVAVRQPRYRYFSDDRESRYFWTIEKSKCRHGEAKHFVCGIYRHYKAKRQWKLVRKRCFALKWKAKDWAYKELCRHEGRPARSLHDRTGRMIDPDG